MNSRRRFVGLLFLLTFTFVGFSQIQRARTPLPTAIATGQVRARVRGTGGSSGDSINIEVAKGPAAPNGPLEVTVPPGTILTNGNAAGQNMVVAEVIGRLVGGSNYTPASSILLTGLDAATYILSAFCLNFEKDNPSESDSFTVGQADALLACIMNSSSELSIEARQAAVWIYTDGVTYEHMNEKFSVSRQDFSAGQDIVSHCRGR
jgi:hypothetical protein